MRGIGGFLADEGQLVRRGCDEVPLSHCCTFFRCPEGAPSSINFFATAMGNAHRSPDPDGGQGASPNEIGKVRVRDIQELG